MSLHLSLAKKVLAHAKDLLKHIFNEAGQDVKAMEKKFLEALKSHAEDELEKAESSVSTSVGSALQQWQKAPRPEDATSVHAAPDLSWDEDKESEPSDVPTEEGSEPSTPSPEASEKPEESKKDDAAAASAPGETLHATGPMETFGDPEQAEFTQPARAPVTSTADLPTEGAASFHGDALPSSAIESVEAGKGDSKHAGSELDLPKADEKEAEAEAPAETEAPVPAVPLPDEDKDKLAEVAAPAAHVEAAPEAPKGGQDVAVADEAKAAQEAVPALNGGLDAQKDEGKPAEAEKPADDKKIESEAKPS